MIIRKSSAFTMMEIIVVIGIIAFLFYFLVMPIMRRFLRTDVTLTKLKIAKVKEAMVEYKLDVGRFPHQKEGLRSLLRQPEGIKDGKWRGPYLDDDEDVLDKWGNEFEYNKPPVRYKEGYKYFEIISFGADGKEGGTGDDAEIHVGA
ncbi:type II secretion system major pseudopilin GspG [Candidatus Babeliales bacterium]|nr:type II secretion system major pseudopilin GspG [Candidatus Babeliales bacterium]